MSKKGMFQKMLEEKEHNREIMRKRLEAIPEIHWEILRYANNHTKEEVLEKYPEHKDVIDRIRFNS